MKSLSRSTRKLLHEVYEKCRDAGMDAVCALRDGLLDLYSWHKRLMVTSTAYPVALLTIGKTLIRAVTPSAAIAVAAVALLAALLDTGLHQPEPDWDEDYY